MQKVRNLLQSLPSSFQGFSLKIALGLKLKERLAGMRNLICTKFDLLGFLVDMKVHVQNVPTESGAIE